MLGCWDAAKITDIKSAGMWGKPLGSPCRNLRLPASADVPIVDG